MKNYLIFSIGLILLLCPGCQSRKSLNSGEGFVELKEGKVWYKVVGEGDKTPLLLLHGGPGAPSYYLNPMAALGDDRPVIFLDQLGCGRSRVDMDTSMMTIENFVEQLEEFRLGLGLNEFYLYGHSWGTMLGTDYYLKYPDAVKAIILASPALSVSRWSDDAKLLIAQLPDTTQLAIKEHSDAGTYDAPEFQQAIGVFYQQYLARKLPWSADLDSAFSNINQEIYLHMWGPSEFISTGNLKNYDRTSRLNEILVPTLFITGEFDEAVPATVQYFHSLVPNSRFEVVSNAAHLTMHDNPEENNTLISEFLSDLENE